MKIRKLIAREIQGRKRHFAIALASVVLAVAVSTGVLTGLRIHDLGTEEILLGKRAETEKRMAVLEDDYRKIMKNLGFNLLILSGEEELSSLYDGGVPSKTMPEEYVAQLAAFPSLYIRHMLPSLQQKLLWPETGKSIVLSGIRGEVPVRNEKLREPIQEAVPKGTIQLGFELHRALGLKSGDKVKLLGRNFLVGQCNPARGDMDDITVWMELAEAQSVLHKPGKISALLALKCHCLDNDLARVRREVQGILPGTQTIEKGSNVLTRAEARDRAAREAAESMAAEKAHRERMRREQERLASLLIPSIVLGGILWIAFLFFGNVSDRKSEIGILRAIGCAQRQIMELFLAKALFIGVLGAVIGLVSGFIFACLWAGRWRASFADLELFLAILAFTPLLALLAAYVPAAYAAGQDPAEVLKEN